MFHVSNSCKVVILALIGLLGSLAVSQAGPSTRSAGSGSSRGSTSYWYLEIYVPTAPVIVSSVSAPATAPSAPANAVQLRIQLPENAILSHDLIEGNYARCGLVTDIELYDDFPVRYHVYARREQRWVRGDWQLLPWPGRNV